MYPDKVGRVIIDGVYDGNDYRAAQWYTNMEDTDNVLSSFFEFCHQAGPLKCPLYAPEVSSIRDRVNAIFDSISEAPLAIPFSANGPLLLTKKLLHAHMFRSTYSPLKLFPPLAQNLLAAEERNLSELNSIGSAFLPIVECDCQPPDPALRFEEISIFSAIACGDAITAPEDPEVYRRFFKNLAEKSAFASQIWGRYHLQCAEWKISAKWRYTDALAGNTSHPLLILSPRFDPVTPLSDAKAVQKRYVGSGLLLQNSNGHSTLSSPSLCTAKHVRAYFLNGTVPQNGTECDVDELPFIGKVGKKQYSMSLEEEELMEALRELVNAVPSMFGAF